MILSLKKAQKKYVENKKSKGWRDIRFFIPPEIKPELMNFKNKLMREYYAKINN